VSPSEFRSHFRRNGDANMAQRYRHQCIAFRVDIGGTADINGCVASTKSIEFDLNRT
jgi:hypothetical protein